MAQDALRDKLVDLLWSCNCPLYFAALSPQQWQEARLALELQSAHFIAAINRQANTVVAIATRPMISDDRGCRLECADTAPQVLRKILSDWGLGGVELDEEWAAMVPLGLDLICGH